VLNLEVARNNKGKVKIGRAKSQLIPIKGKYFEKDQAVDEIVNRYNKKVQPYLQEVIGKTQVNLECQKYYKCNGESNMGNFVSDTLREHTGTDICLMIPSHFQNSIKAGEVKAEHLHVMHPWYDGVATVKMTGETIRNIVEAGVSDKTIKILPSGIRVTYDSNRKGGGRVLEITTLDGKLLDREKEYTVTTKDFLLDASEQFTEYKNFSDRKAVKESIHEIMVNRFRSDRPVNPCIDGRIKDVSFKSNKS
jgi:5'-nucleotidase / UDP-sugar diphosphatase